MPDDAKRTHGSPGAPQEGHARSVADQPTITSAADAAPGGVPGHGTAPGPGAAPPGAAPGFGGQYAHPAGPAQPYGHGYASGYPSPYVWGTPPPPQGMAIAALVLGIVSMVLIMTIWGSFLAILTAPVAIGLGVSARRKAALGEQGGRSYATAGMVMGIVGTVISLVASVLLVLLITVWGDDLDDGGSTSDPYTVDATRTATAVAAPR